MTTITWVITDLKYEISSKEHLLQLMNKGSLYTDSGSPPSSYWSSDYIQTVDIDLESDSSITPIGTLSDSFTGSYDGSSFSITDWNYSTTGDNIGLFGYISESTLSNINMEGTWDLTGNENCGFLVGNVQTSSNVYNITGDFSSGSISATGGNVGAIIGNTDYSTIEGITSKGTLSSIISTGRVGGIIGQIQYSTLKYTRNLVRFTLNPALDGTSSGGVCGNMVNCDIEYLINAMIGNIHGTNISGVVANMRASSSQTSKYLVNSMKGDIIGTVRAGGIFCIVVGNGTTGTFDSLVNYMTGNITGPTDAGGITSRMQAYGTNGHAIITNSVNAMNGIVTNAGCNSIQSGSSLALQVITDFGLSYSSLGVSSVLTDLTGIFAPHPNFGDLEYFPFEFTDSNGTSYFWEFVFANVSGSSSYSEYTHFVISSQDIGGPIELQLNLADNSTEYLHKLNVTDNEITVEDNVVVIYSSGTVFDSSDNVLYPVPLVNSVSTSPFSYLLSWIAVDDATSYRLEYSESGSNTLELSSVTENLTLNLSNLNPITTYYYQLYSSEDGINYTIVDDASGNFTTSTNESSGYDMDSFLEDGIYNFSSFSPDIVGQMATIITELLGQDESIKIVVNGSVEEILVSGLSGETIDVDDNDSYILPFQTTSGSNQTMNVTGLYTGVLNYDETQDGIEIEGILRFAGDSFILNGVRITIKEV